MKSDERGADNASPTAPHVAERYVMLGDALVDLVAALDAGHERANDKAAVKVKDITSNRCRLTHLHDSWH